MTEEERWLKVEEIVERVVSRQLKSHGFKEKAKIEIQNGRMVGITEQQMQVWKESYAAVDVDAELKKMAGWIVGNPHLSPKSHVGRFINTWLTREQNRASIRSIPTAPRPTSITPSLCEYCRLPSTGAVGGRRACDAHFQDAMNGTKPQLFMPGIVAKPVAP